MPDNLCFSRSVSRRQIYSSSSWYNSTDIFCSFICSNQSCRSTVLAPKYPNIIFPVFFCLMSQSVTDINLFAKSSMLNLYSLVKTSTVSSSSVRRFNSNVETPSLFRTLVHIDSVDYASHYHCHVQKWLVLLNL